MYKFENYFMCGYWIEQKNCWHIAENGKTEIEARAKMLIYLIENKHLTIE